MTQESFMKSLNYHLLVRVNGEKRKSIVQDYADFFAEGKAMGERDEALCQKFGAPQDIAKELSGDDGKKHILKYVALTALIASLIMFLWAYDLFFVVKIFYPIVLPIASIVITILCGVAKKTSVSRKSQAIALSVFGIAALGFIAFYALLLNLWSFSNYFTPAKIGGIMTLFYSIVNLALIIAFVYVLIHTSKLPKWTLLLVPCAFTIIMIMGDWMIMLGDLSHLNMFTPNQNMLTAVLYNMPAFVIAIWLSLRKGKV